MFKEISDLKEIEKTFLALPANKVIITAKGQSEDLYHFLVERISPKEGAICSLVKSNLLPKEDQQMLCSFEIAGEKYFFQSLAHRQNNNFYSIDCPKTLFQLQRRQSFRIKIPPSYKAVTEVNKINETVTNIKGKLLDISSGGCKMLIPDSGLSFKENDQLSCNIHIGSREPLSFLSIIRYLKKENNKNEISLGVEFKNLKPADEQKLVSITMDLYREFFATLRRD